VRETSTEQKKKINPDYKTQEHYYLNCWKNICRRRTHNSRL